MIGKMGRSRRVVKKRWGRGEEKDGARKKTREKVRGKVRRGR